MQLCLALDLESQEACLNLLEQLKGLNLWIKLGLRGFIREGPSFLERIKNIDSGFKLFLDLKLHDISYTMQETVIECAKLGVDMLTLHASSGEEALKNAVQALKTFEGKKPLLMGVTLLTSLDESQAHAIYHAPLLDQTLYLAKLCFDCGLDGVVCSVFESLAIKQATKADFLTLTPGIRPPNTPLGDQKRVGTIADAKKAHADFIVMGRPIYSASNPLEITRHILEQI
ncbi:orotidine-5'-phosphate decarboxylase [Helicobacter bizzozeronii]|uniref:orotidine-5'-phosphate decarboxylase n=1 Tax=Helicobacter bizzozeronii TaxID=56877 RepID=UPI000CF0F91C|nr:orotidine-5'-phosphate decarboxylase [Helicobacter bizzozeronii]